MLKEAYEYGQRLAAAEKGYGSLEQFTKEAAGFGMGLNSIGRAAWQAGSRGALGGAAIGAAGNMAFGDSNQSLLERAGKGALGGAAVGGGLGAAGGAAGQSMYRRAAGIQARAGARGSNTALKSVREGYAGKPNFWNGAAQDAGKWLNTNLNSASLKAFG